MIHDLRGGAGPHHRRDDGYTLVEGVLAFALVAVLVVAGTTLIANAVTRTSAFAQRQAAPMLASQAVERLRAGDVTVTAQLATGLARGRTSADVTAQWADAGAPPDLAGLWPAYDPAATAAAVPAVPAVPLVTTSVVGGTTYTVATYIGLCDRPRAASATATCQRSGTAGGLPAAGQVRMVQAVVQVTWAPVGGTSCPAGGCRYSVTALLDPTADLTWRA